MTKLLSVIAFLLGAIAVFWMGLAFASSNLLALGIITVIGVAYSVGFNELWRFQQATDTLTSALSTTQDKVLQLDDWLDKLHPSLQNTVRLRIEGERIGLPTPVLTPYLVGLLVMLGLLGTFAGMVDTLKGAVMALEGTTELEAIRAGLAAPIKGLAMAFGTSVAGVATSAMLGFISTLSRRDRMLAARQLDSKVGTVFQAFSLAYNRQQTYKAMQLQAQTLPDVAEKLTVLAQQLASMSTQIESQLIDNQQKFHESTANVYNNLATSVDKSLKESLAESGRLAGASIQPIVQELMQGISIEAKNTYQQLTTITQQQLETLTQHFSDTSQEVSNAWQSSLAAHEQSNQTFIVSMGTSLEAFNSQFENTSTTMIETFNRNSVDWFERQQINDQQRLEHWDVCFQQVSSSLQQSTNDIAENNKNTSTVLLGEINNLLSSAENLVQTRIDNESVWLATYSDRLKQLTSTLTTEFEKLRDAEESRGTAAVTRLAELQHAVTDHLATLGNALEQPMTRLIQIASETPRAAAEVIEQMRAEITKNIEHDNSLLEDRRRIMSELNTLSDTLEQNSTGQREAIEQIVSSSTLMLQEIKNSFGSHVEAEVAKLSDITDHFAVSAIEMASLGETFGSAVQLFNTSNTHLANSLIRIEESLKNSTTRSDEQLGYYVAQAREIIDHSMLSQQEIIEQIRQLSRKGNITTTETELR